MTKTNVLFLCPDNSLLGPLAEAYLNHRARPYLRAFSAGVVPAEQLNRHVERLLASDGLEVRGLSPKSVEIFRMPHAVIPDRIIYLTDMKAVAEPPFWVETTSSVCWDVVYNPAQLTAFGSCAACYRQIKQSIDQLLDPPQSQILSLVG